MIGMFVKELRENAKWAAAIFGVILLTVYTMLRQHNPQLMFELSDAPMAFFAPAAGLLIGIAQSALETRMDHWAFVVHRPMKRPAIFAAKCAAGLLLLYVSLELPCLLAAAWAAKPGNLRIPFGARMILPSLAVTLNAGCYYFAGMALTLRKARWLGTRLLPIGLAILCSFSLQLTPEFWQALVFIVVGHVIGAAAAWGAYSTAGEGRAGFLSSFSLGAMVFCGVLGIGAALVGFLGIFQSTTSWTWWRIDRDGNLRNVTTTIHGNDRTFLVTDAAGRRLPQYDSVDLDDPAHADLFIRFRAGLIDDRLIPWPSSTLYYRGSYRTDLPGVIPLRNVAPPGVRVRAACMFDVQNRIIDMYDPTTRGLMGTVGPAGFTPRRNTPAERFPGEPHNPSNQSRSHLLAFDSVVYWMELDHRRVRAIFRAMAADPVVSATEYPPDKDPTIFIATRTRLHVLRSSGEVQFSTPLDPDMTRNYYDPAVVPSNHHVFVWGGPLSPVAFRPALMEFTPDGTLVARSEPIKFRSEISMTRPRSAILALVYPAAGLPLYREGMIAWLFNFAAQKWWWFHGWLFGSSLVCAAATFFLCRRYGMRRGRTIAWTAANLLLGPGGIVAMAALNEMPARERCAACGKTRFAGHQKCPHCARALPPAEHDGREIFEPADAVAATA